MTSQKKCKVCGNPNISLFWSGGFGDRFYCSFSCSVKAGRYGSLMLSIIFPILLYALTKKDINQSNIGTSSINILFFLIFLFIELILILSAIYGFVIKIKLYDDYKNQIRKFHICPECKSKIEPNLIICSECGGLIKGDKSI